MRNVCWQIWTSFRMRRWIHCSPICWVRRRTVPGYEMAKRRRRNLPGAVMVEPGTSVSGRERSTSAGDRGPGGAVVYQPIQHRYGGNADHPGRCTTEDLDAVLVARRVEHSHPRSHPAGRCGHGHPESWQPNLVLSAESEPHGEDAAFDDDGPVDGQSLHPQ